MIGVWLQAIWDRLCGRSYQFEDEKVDWSHVPKTLDDAVNQLIEDNRGNDELKDLLAKGESSFVGHLHFSGGINMRNDWGFWNYENPSDLAKWFNARGIYHADDMSGIIYRTFYRRLKGEEERLDEQIQNIRQHWTEHGLDPDHLFDGKPAA